MLQLLQSNQPASWVIIPLLVVLLLVAGVLGAEGVDGVQGPLLGAMGVLAGSRIIHLMHVESGMRTRPTAIPSWAWVVSATPLVWVTRAELWWASVLVLFAMRLSLTLREGESTGRSFFWMGAALIAGPFLAPGMWVWALLMPLIVLAFRPFRVSETLSLLLGMMMPVALVLVFYWWTEGSIRWPWGKTFNSDFSFDWRAWILLPFAALGWALRQQSLSHATARQRFARQVTQWMGLAVLLSTSLGWVLTGHLGPSEAAHPAYAFFCSWTLGWCLPRNWRGGRWVPWVLLLLSLTLAFFLGSTSV